jgi:hypothetical protein
MGAEHPARRKSAAPEPEKGICFPEKGFVFKAHTGAYSAVRIFW